MGRKPPSGFGSRQMITSSMACGHCPAASHRIRSLRSASTHLRFARIRALGCTRSHPRPVLFGKDARLCRSSVKSSSGGTSQSPHVCSLPMVPLSGDLTAHIVPHSSAWSSATCWASRGDLIEHSCLRTAARSSADSPSVSSRSSMTNSLLVSTLVGTHPMAVLDMRCCLPRPRAGPPLSQS